MLTAVRGKKTPACVVMVAATVNRQLEKLVTKDFPGMVRAATSSLHKGVAGAQHSFMPLAPEQDKLHTLTQVCSTCRPTAAVPSQPLNRSSSAICVAITASWCFATRCPAAGQWSTTWRSRAS